MLYFLGFPIESKGTSVLESGRKLGVPQPEDAPAWSRFSNEMDEFILMVEGYQTHASRLDPGQASEVLQLTKSINRSFSKFQSGLVAMEWKDDAIPLKLKYATRALNRLEALLHKAAYKSAPVEPTPQHIREGLATMSNEAMGKRLAKG